MNTIVDECDYTPQVMREIVFPLLTETQFKLFAASSAKPTGYLADLIAARNPDGTPMVNSLTLGNPCDACVHMGIKVCTHTDAINAPWKDPKKSARVFAMYAVCGDEQRALSDLANIVGPHDRAVFLESQFSYIFDAEPPTTIPESEREHAEVVFVGIDPAGRGPDEFAISAVARFGNHYEVRVKFFVLSSPSCSSILHHTPSVLGLL